MATRSLNQLEAGIERIEDPIVREAMSSLLEFVNGLQGSGLSTRGKVTAKDISLENGSIYTADGVLYTPDINTAGGGKWRAVTYQGIIPGSDTTNKLPAPNGEIFGVIGWTELSSSTIWSMITTSSISNGIYLGGNDNKTSTINLINGHTTSKKFRLIIFYRENE